MSTKAPLYHNPEFDRYAEKYDSALAKGLSVSGESKEYFAEGRVQWLGKCLGRMGHEAGALVDFGCGIGSTTPYLLKLPGAKSVLGLEVSPESLKVAERTHGSTRVRFELSSQYRPAGNLDLAFCNGVFHHIPPAARADAVNYIFETLRPGGLFSLWENNPWNPGTRYLMSRIPFDRDAIMLSHLEVRKLLREAGFEILRMDFLFVFPRALKSLRPMERWMTGLPIGAQYQVLARKR
jgi:SAM-dependent methyltransferase